MNETLDNEIIFIADEILTEKIKEIMLNTPRYQDFNDFFEKLIEQEYKRTVPK